MSTIHRTLVLNPVEPAPISMKLRTGIENVVEVEYLRHALDDGVHRTASQRLAVGLPVAGHALPGGRVGGLLAAEM